MLSNSELKLLLEEENPPIRHLPPFQHLDNSRSPVQPASLDLHVGEILVPPKIDGMEHPIEHKHDRYVIPSGGSVVLLTREEINFDATLAGIMFPKSSGLAERGILLTNCGHVDPGYKGHLRYAVVNLGVEPYEIRKDDPVASICIFRLTVAANPDWSEGRRTPARRTQDFVRALSQDLLSIRRIQKEAELIARDTVNGSAMWLTLISTLVAISVGVVSAGVTLAIGWFTLLSPQIDAIGHRVDQIAATQQIIHQTREVPSAVSHLKAPSQPPK